MLARPVRGAACDAVVYRRLDELFRDGHRRGLPAVRLSC